MTAAASSRVAVSSPPRVAARVGAGRRSPKTYSETRQRARPADPAFDPSRHHRGRRSRLFLTIARANPLRSFDPEEVTIEGLVPLDQICDEFVCKSSPAVEASLRQIATDVCALRENARSLTPFANDIEYDDGARVFKGREGFKNHAFIAENIGNPAAAVESMRMNAVDEAVIEARSHLLHRLVPVRPRSRGERRSLRTFAPGVSLRPRHGLNPDTPRCL